MEPQQRKDHDFLHIYVRKWCYSREESTVITFLRATEYMMFHYALVYMAYFFSRWLPRNQRSKFQIINVVFVMLILIPQVYVLTRLRSSRYCRQDLLSNLLASIVLSFVAIGFAVIFTLMDPVPQGFRAAYHMFGLVSFGQGLCTIIMTLTAATCAKTTPELYYLSLILTLACILSTVFFGVKGGVWITQRLPCLV